MPHFRGPWTFPCPRVDKSSPWERRRPRRQSRGRRGRRPSQVQPSVGPGINIHQSANPSGASHFQHALMMSSGTTRADTINRKSNPRTTRRLCLASKCFHAREAMKIVNGISTPIQNAQYGSEMKKFPMSASLLRLVARNTSRYTHAAPIAVIAGTPIEMIHFIILTRTFKGA